MHLINQLFHLGTQKADNHLHRSIILANQFALIVFLLTIVLITFLIAISGITPGILRIGISFFFYPLIPLLQYYGYNKAGRLLASCFVPVFIIILMSFSSARSTPLIHTASYFPPRILAMATCILPMLVFDTLREKKWITLSLTICAVCVLGYDFLLQLIGHEVEFYSRRDLFLYYNLVFGIHFVTLTASAFLMKRLTDKKDDENIRLMSELHEKNKKLESALHNQESLIKEITNQSEELRTNQEKLQDAYQLIEKQKEELRKHNEHLEELVKQKSQELLMANDELSKHNSELRQFSYTLSHNLRGPVARLIGLTNLLSRDQSGLSEEQRYLLRLLKNSTTDLDTIIRDLNKIIDLRNAIYGIKEKVDLLQEVTRILLTLKEQFPADAQIETDFAKAPFVYGIRPMINSVLYNLISNAIKYRAHTRPLKLILKSQMNGDAVLVTISDNGLGINLDQFGKDLFSMYKRFHTHTEGKGLGLYLVKTQMELMGGSISVESKLNTGTTFILNFKKPAEVEGQICDDNEYGRIYYNARLNLCGIIWKQQPTSEAYRKIFEKSLEILRLYNTPFWISDLRKQGRVPSEDQIWMLTTILPDAVNNGLSYVAVIFDPKQHNEDYLKRIDENLHNAGVKVKFFQSKNEAEAWLESIQESATIKLD
ncbi:MAG: ATP-binding protein [Cyclobacteriaceae bacterium]|nr:ATP-binding protein [Cyclobacteriaceae bacterium]